MERHRLTDDRAFALLVRASQHTLSKLRDVAARLVQSGNLDGPKDGRGGGDRSANLAEPSRDGIDPLR